jgi:tetratricopeptide (TPR) repeat protein
VNLGKIDCWPGTKIYHDAIERGVVTDKIAFIEQGCPLVNMTQLSEDEFMELIRCVWLLHEGLLWPGRLLEARVGADGSASARCQCPHCQAEVVFEHLELTPMHTDRLAHRLPCDRCGRVFDLPLRLPPVDHAPEVRALFDAARAHRDAGRLDAAMERLLALFEITRQHPAAVALAASIRLAQEHPRRARELVRLAMKQNPTAPGLFDWAAKAYAACGDKRMARIFQNQAQLLREHRSPALNAANMAQLDPMEHLCLGLFPAGEAEAVADRRPGGQ